MVIAWQVDGRLGVKNAGPPKVRETSVALPPSLCTPPTSCPEWVISGHSTRWLGMSAFGRNQTWRRDRLNVRFVPVADICLAFWKRRSNLA